MLEYNRFVIRIYGFDCKVTIFQNINNIKRCQTALNALKTPQTIYISMANNLFCNENIRQKERTPKEDARTLKYLYQ